VKLKLVISSAVLLAVPLLWVASGSGSPRAAAAVPAHKVKVHDNFFERRSIRIKPNEKVVWVWKGMNRHNVRFTKVPKGAKRGGSKIKTTGKWRRTFKIKGNYRYICKLYTGMRGTITVKDQQPPAQSTAILGAQQGK
jgi:plastocyanin